MKAVRYNDFVFVEEAAGRSPEYYKLRRKADCDILAERIGKAAFDVVTSNPGTWLDVSTLSPLPDGKPIPRT